MKIKISRETMLKALQKVGNIVNTRNTLPVLSNILFEAADGKLKLTGTDLEIRMETVVDAEVIAVEGLLAALQVDGRREARLVDAEEVEPAAILAPFVTIVLVLGGGVHVAEEQGDAFLSGEALQQRLPARGVNFFSKHSENKDSKFLRIFADGKDERHA